MRIQKVRSHYVPSKYGHKPEADATDPFESIIDRRERIAARTYTLADRRGFAADGELDDRLTADRLAEEGLSLPSESIGRD